MAPRLNAANQAETSLDAAVASGDTSISVTDASVFPSAPFRATISDSSSDEIIEVGSVDTTNNNLDSVSRGQEDTTAQSWSSGDTVEQRFTAGTYGELVDTDTTYSAGSGLDLTDTTFSLTNDSLTVAGNLVSLGGSTTVDHADLSNIGDSDHHTRPTAGDGIVDNSNSFDARLPIEDGGTSVTDAYGINFGSNLAVTDDGDNTVTVDAAGASPGGSDTQIQYNNAGSFDGTTGMTWDDSVNQLTVSNQFNNNSGAFHVPGTTQSMYVGDDNTSASGFAAIALGPGAQAQDTSATAVGRDASAGGGSTHFRSTAIGYDASANTHQSTAIGAGAQTNADQEVVFGGGNAGTDVFFEAGDGSRVQVFDKDNSVIPSSVYEGVNVEDSGTSVLNTTGINFGDSLNVSDDGDGSVTVDAAGGSPTTATITSDYTTSGEDSIYIDSLFKPYSFVNGVNTGSFDISNDSTSPQAMNFGDGGSKLYVADFNQIIVQYNLSTAWDVTTASLANTLDVSTNVGEATGVYMGGSGNNLIVVDNSGVSVHKYTLTTSYDISTASHAQSKDLSTNMADPKGITQGGAYSWEIIDGSLGDTSIHDYGTSLGGTFDLTTWSHDAAQSISSNTATPVDITHQNPGSWSAGDNIYITNDGAGVDHVSRYTLDDVNTAAVTFVESHDVSGTATGPRGVSVKPDGTREIVADNGSDSLYSYKPDGVSEVTLASADATDGNELRIQDITGNAGQYGVSIVTEGGETINGSSSKSLNRDYEVLEVQSDGVDWFNVEENSTSVSNNGSEVADTPSDINFGNGLTASGSNNGVTVAAPLEEYTFASQFTQYADGLSNEQIYKVNVAPGGGGINVDRIDVQEKVTPGSDPAVNSNFTVGVYYESGGSLAEIASCDLNDTVEPDAGADLGAPYYVAVTNSTGGTVEASVTVNFTKTS